jgi:ADP-heptose:LPS heptosyltransferase
VYNPANILNSFISKFFLNIFFNLNKKIFFIKESSNITVVVIAFLKIGDTVFSIPAIKILQEIFGDNLILICTSESKSVYRLKFPDLRFYTVESDDCWFRRIAKFKTRKRFRKVKPKFIIDLTGTIQSVSLMTGQKAEAVFGICDNYLLNFYTKAVIKRKAPHLTDMYLDAVFQCSNKTNFKIEKEYPCEINKDGKILIHPFAGWKAKEWNLHKYIKLAKDLNILHTSAIITQRDSIPEDIKNKIADENVELIETKSPEEMIANINVCSCLIGNDSGPVYIAAVLGKPTFTIYGPTNPGYSLPFGRHHSYIQKSLKCSPEENKQYCFTDAGRNGCPTNECMNVLSFDEVYKSVSAFLKDNGVTK